MKNKFLKYIRIFIGGFLFLMLNNSCKKQNDFLDAKPNQALIVPSTLADYQLLLNDEYIFNTIGDPTLGQMSDGDTYTTNANWAALDVTEQFAYIWAKNVYQGVEPPDWDQPYVQVYYANTVLEGLSTIKPTSAEQTQWNNEEGTALFFRSWAFYNLVQTFALPYKASTASADLGIPLRLTSNLNVKSTRATEQQCYDQIIGDLKTALTLVPTSANAPANPTKWAVNAFLARVYLAMGDYPDALIYSNACLQQNAVLTNYNTLTPASRTLTSGITFMSEDIYHADLINYKLTAVNRYAHVDSVLYKMYDANDLRKTLFFYTYTDGSHIFQGSYAFIDGTQYSGLATDEIYLIRAECNARAGNTANAMKDLNTLLVNRYITGTFTPRTASSSTDALSQILQERRKELLYRGLRWTDLRRLNQDPNYAVTLTRVINGTTYTLPPNDPRYALPIPDEEIETSGIQQNQR